jgi:hypothetical protein
MGLGFNHTDPIPGEDCTKSLSEKLSGSNGDPGTRERPQREIVRHLLLPPDEPSPNAIPPGVRALYDPAAHPGAGDCPLRLLRFAAAPQVGGRAPLRQRLAPRCLVAPGVQAQVLRLRRGGLGALAHEGLQGGLDPVPIRAMGAVHGDAEGQALAVCHQAPLGPKLAASGRVVAHLVPPQAAPWSSPRPSPAPPPPGLSGSHTSASPPARAARIPAPAATHEPGHARYWRLPSGAAPPRGSTTLRRPMPLIWRPSFASCTPAPCILWRSPMEV